MFLMAYKQLDTDLLDEAQKSHILIHLERDVQGIAKNLSLLANHNAPVVFPEKKTANPPLSIIAQSAPITNTSTSINNSSMPAVGMSEYNNNQRGEEQYSNNNNNNNDQDEFNDDDNKKISADNYQSDEENFDDMVKQYETEIHVENSHQDEDEIDLT